MREPVRPENVRYSSPSDGEEIPEFSCDNEKIKRWFCDTSANDHQHFDCRVTYVWLDGEQHLAAFYSICIKKEPQSNFVGQTFADRVFEDERVTTIHLKWLAVRARCERRRLGSIIMGRVVEDAYTIITKAGAHALTLRYLGAASERLYRNFGFSDYGSDGERKLYLAAEAIIDAVETNY